MAIDYSQLAFPKGAPKMLAKQERDKDRMDVDREESATVKARSGGRCEVVWFGKKAKKVQRCERIASQIHHMLGGSGRRARGKSLRAEHKQHVCDTCHPLITGHVLRRVGADVPLWSDEYEHLGK